MAAPTLSSSWRDSLSNSLCDATSELADRAQFQGRLGGDDRVPLSSGPIGLCIHKMRLTTPFPISICDRAGTQAWSSEHLRRARCEAPQTRRPFFPSTSKCFGLRLWSSNNLISGVLGSFDRYCRVGLIFAGAVRTKSIANVSPLRWVGARAAERWAKWRSTKHPKSFKFAKITREPGLRKVKRESN